MAKHEIPVHGTEVDRPATKRAKMDTPNSTPPTLENSETTANSPSPKPVTTATEPSEPKKSVASLPSVKAESPPPASLGDSEATTKTQSPKSVTTATEPPELKKPVASSPSVKAGPPPPPTSDLATKSEIEAYFEHHFHSTRVFTSPGDKRHPDSVPDYHISSTTLVNILSKLSDAATKHFQQEYLDDVYVFIDRLEQIREFAGVALEFPKIGGRIKLDSRILCDPEKERMPHALDSKMEQTKFRVKVEKLSVWKKEVRKVVDLVGEEMGLDGEAFEEKLASINSLPAKLNEPLVKVGVAWINPVAEDLKILKCKKNDWSVTISCDSVLANEEKQKFQLWGDIGRVSGLWRYYEAQKKDMNTEKDVEQVEEKDITS